MKFFQYWASADTVANDANGRALRLRKWAGSEISIEDAAKSAKQSVEELARRIASIAADLSRNYGYGTGGRPEELIERIGTTAAITRNRNGCQVLNADHAMFIDIDMPNNGRGFFAWLSGRTEKKYKEKLDRWLLLHPEAGMRIYRTAGGYRYLLTHAPLKVDDTTQGWQVEMGADKLYVRLCKVQQCFRARLTPKPFRLNMKNHDLKYPYETQELQSRFDTWNREYNDKSRDYAVCQFVEHKGSGRIHPDLDAVIKKHDAMTEASSGKPLA